MEDTRESKQARPSLQPTPDLDSFSKLPPEILQSIFSYLANHRPPALSHRLLPFSRHATFHSVELTSFRSFELLNRTFKTTAGVAGITKSFAIGLMDGTEMVLAKEKPSLRELLLETLALLPAVRELQMDWMSAAVLLSEEAANGGVLRSMQTLRMSVLLAQLNSADFITYRFALLSRYSALRFIELMVLPYDTTSPTATAFELFPASAEDTPPPLDMQPISHLTSLTLGGALCDQRVVNVLRAFSSLSSVTLYDSFASPHLTPAIAALEPSSIRTLRLQRLIATPPPVTLPLPAPEPEWTRFTSLEELQLGMPLSSDSLPLALSQLPNLRTLIFSATSNPTAPQIRALLTTSRPPSLMRLILSHITGQVGAPISSSTLPSIHLWLSAVRAAQADPSESVVEPHFPLLDWYIPTWSPSLTLDDAEALFTLSRSLPGMPVKLEGSVVSACLTTYVLERQLGLWTSGAADELDEEERAAIEGRELWDALAVRYRGRLLGEGEQQGVGMARWAIWLPADGTGQDLDAASLELISAILAQDLEDQSNYDVGQQFKMELTMQLSRPPSPSLIAGQVGSSSSNGPAAASSSSSAVESESDRVFSLRQQPDLVHSSLSKAAIPSLAQADHQRAADHLRAQQLARQLEQELRVEATDAIFARALQRVDDEGGDIDRRDRRGMEGVLGEDKVKKLRPPSLHVYLSLRLDHSCEEGLV
ncbi:hypothetical protein JCM8547_006895 [Rhodosporidiobolus lusitaniae]